MWVQNKFLCAARYTNVNGVGQGKGDAAAVGTTAGLALETTKKYYCSDGENNHSASNTNVSSIWGKDWFRDQTKKNQAADPRLELMLISCRQMSTNCGGKSIITSDKTALYDATTATTAADKAKYWRTVQVTTMKQMEKCSYVFSTKYGAPTFKATKQTGQTYFLNGSAGSGWEIHYVEYGDNTDFSNTLVIDATTKFLNAWTTDWAKLKARVYDQTMFNGW